METVFIVIVCIVLAAAGIWGWWIGNSGVDDDTAETNNKNKKENTL